MAPAVTGWGGVKNQSVEMGVQLITGTGNPIGRPPTPAAQFHNGGAVRGAVCGARSGVGNGAGSSAGTAAREVVRAAALC